MYFLDIFAGIGGFRLGLEMAGHECVGHIEWDKFAQASYQAMHKPKESEYCGWDIRDTRANELPRADIWAFGFPCQDISVAGGQTGFRGGRSSLFFTVTNLIRQLDEECKPSILFIENVKNLLGVNRGFDFAKLLIELDEIGYDAEWQVLNSKDFGVPQNRERVFIIGHLRGRSECKVFPIRQHNPKTARGWQGDVSGKGHASQQDRVYTVDGLMNCIPASQTKSKVKILVKAVITPNRLNKRQNGRRFKEEGEPMFTLTSQDRHGIQVSDRIRALTPRECFRLQGFPDEYFDRAAEVTSDSQLYKQAGNSVTVNVIYEIARRI